MTEQGKGIALKSGQFGAKTLLAVSLILSFCGVSFAMQNPIYSGVNRIELSCPDQSSMAQSLCGKVKKALEDRMRLQVALAGSTATRPNTSLAPLGVLKVDLELQDTPPTRARLIFTNTKPIGPKPTQDIGSWLKIDPVKLSDNSLSEIAEELVSRAP